MALYDATATAKEDDDKTAVSQWTETIERYERGSQEWKERCEKIIKIYLDQHRTQASPRRFALLWSNIETLKPAVYARLPVAVVSRRHKDSDPVGRKASEIVERCINTTFDLSGLNSVMELVRDDRLLCSRGTAWVRYEADFEDAKPEPDVAADVPAPAQRVSSERACVDHVHWADFGHTLNRTWPEVTAVWRRVYMTKEKVTKRWSKEIADKLNYEVRPEYAQRGGADIKDSCEPQAIICEIWDKLKRETIWLAKEEKLLLERGAPPLSFRDFFPCPKPTYGTLATGSLIPTPDYRYYQDQAEEIDDLTQKIADLTGWLRLKGFYAGGPSSEGTDAIEELLRMEGNQVLVKVESWAGFAEKGGAKGLIEWLPLEVIVTALREAVATRQQLIQDVFQITGISDILRGETDPNETLGAQEIKAQTGSRRQSPIQRDIARFARDLAEMIGEIISENFQPETIAQMSGFDLTMQAPPEMAMQAAQLAAQVQGSAGPGIAGMTPPNPPPDPRAQQALQQLQQQMEQFKFNAQVIELLRDEKTRGFRIEIETDSTIEPDEQAEKQRRIEFLGAVGEFLQKAQMAVATMPLLAPMLGEMLMFLVRGFRAGRSLEDQVEQTMQKITQQSQQPQPNPEQEKMQAEMARDQEQFKQESAARDQEMAQKREVHDQNMQLLRAKALATSDKSDGDGEGASSGGGNSMVLMMELINALKVMNAPKRIVRDQNGRAQGVEPITQAQAPTLQ